MVEFFKELTDAANARIRSPFIGSIAIVFLTLNWKALAILLFSNGSIELRILTFDGMTTLRSLVFAPAVLGIAIALILPWSKLLGASIAKRPSGVLRRLQHDESQQFRIYQLNGDAAEAEARARYEEATERAKIEAAKRLEDAREIKPELEEELKEDREQKTNGTMPSPNLQQIWELELLEMAAKSEDGRIWLVESGGIAINPESKTGLTDWSNSHEDKKLLFDVMKDMQNELLFEFHPAEFKDQADSFEITTAGYTYLKEYRD